MKYLADTIDTWTGSELDWGLWKQWVLATTIGLVVGGGIAAALPIESSLLFGLTAGLGMGASQWSLLRVHFKWMSANPTNPTIMRKPRDRWILYSSLSVGLVFAIGAGGILAGVIVGMAQWLILSRHYPRAWWWIIASIAGWPAGQLVSFELLMVLGPIIGIGLWAALTGLASGASTGVVLAWLASSKEDPDNASVSSSPATAEIPADGGSPAAITGVSGNAED